MHAITRCSRVLAINPMANIRRVAALRHASVRRAYSTPAPDDMDEGERNIHEKLSKRFDTSKVQVQDVSGAQHYTIRMLSLMHFELAGGCGTFYAITIASKAFAGIPTVKQHRLVNETLKSEISGIHGLQVRTATVVSSLRRKVNCHVVEDHRGRSLGIKRLLV